MRCIVGDVSKEWFLAPVLYECYRAVGEVVGDISLAANKFAGVRAAPCHDALTVEMSRRHNDANVLCLSADLLGERIIDQMIEQWLNTDFEGGRHARRLDKITEIENETKECE